MDTVAKYYGILVTVGGTIILQILILLLPAMIVEMKKKSLTILIATGLMLLNAIGIQYWTPAISEIKKELLIVAILLKIIIGGIAILAPFILLLLAFGETPPQTETDGKVEKEKSHIITFIVFSIGALIYIIKIAKFLLA